MPTNATLTSSQDCKHTKTNSCFGLDFPTIIKKQETLLVNPITQLVTNTNQLNKNSLCFYSIIRTLSTDNKINIKRVCLFVLQNIHTYLQTTKNKRSFVAVKIKI